MEDQQTGQLDQYIAATAKLIMLLGKETNEEQYVCSK